MGFESGVHGLEGDEALEGAVGGVGLWVEGWVEGWRGGCEWI